MTATDKLNSAARSMGWANWAEVISHNAPPHVINAVVMRAMEGTADPSSDLSEALEIIDDYLNAGHKEARAAASEKAKAFYKKHTGKEYLNKIDREPALTWRPGARVRITGNSKEHGYKINEIVTVDSKAPNNQWLCRSINGLWFISESDAVVVR